MKVLVVCKQDQRAYSLAKELTDCFAEKGVIATVWKKELPLCNCSEIEIVLVLGGDGTILRAGRYFAPFNIPIIGINLGQVGFLSSIEADQALFYVNKIIRKEWHLVERLMLAISVVRNKEQILQTTILNDIVMRSTVCHTTTIKLKVNGETYITCRGDGIICATPTGSTGYSLSVGGVVLEPAVDAIVVTPICPQLSCAKSIVLRADSKLSFVLDNDRSTRLYLDGAESIELKKGDNILVEHAPVTTKIIQFDDFNQYTKLARICTRAT